MQNTSKNENEHQQETIVHVQLKNKYFELKNLWGANGVPQTQTTC